MKTNTPDHAKTNLPDSDETARHPFAEDAETVEDVNENIEGLQTSNKTGKHSSVEKLAASRPEFSAGRGAQPVPGAFGENDEHLVTGRLASPETSRFRCSGCGRYFDAQQDLSQHETECRLAKSSTASGRASLEHEDSTPHARNDAGSKEHPFRHGPESNRS